MNDLSKEYTKEEFNTEAPYTLLFERREDGFAYLQLFNELSANAERVGFKRFGTMVKAYFAQHEDRRGGISSVINNLTSFHDQPIELFTGDWIANDEGIVRRNERQGLDIACTHPILPVQRLTNIEDDTVRLKLLFRRDFKGWKEVIVNKSALFTASELRKLADKDISVSDKNASYLVEYLQDIDDLNHSNLPEVQSVGHLGWTANGLFCPYMGGLEFDGNDNFRKIFKAVRCEGELAGWIKAAQGVRQGDSPARIILATSFASVILKSIGKLNFIVHLWGGTEVGKTVAQLLAISIWADPNDGAGYLQTFNGTVVGLEQQASFLNNFPLVLDEFQLVRDKRQFEQSVYMLCEGIGKTRGAKTGGLQKTPTWKNCVITSGESPITYSSSGGGAVNRIIEIECREKLFKDPHGLLEVIRTNFGHAGKIFMAMLSADASKEKAAQLFKQFYRELGESSTEKQTMAAAAILTADALATEWLFCDDRALTPSDIEPFLHSKESVDVGARGYDYIQDFCTTNKAKFSDNSDPCFGSISENEVRIVRATFEKACEEGGFNAKAMLAWLDRHSLLSKGKDKNLYKSSKVNGRATRCACISLAGYSDGDEGFVTVDPCELPFK